MSYCFFEKSVNSIAGIRVLEIIIIMEIIFHILKETGQFVSLMDRRYFDKCVKNCFVCHSILSNQNQLTAIRLFFFLHCIVI